MTDISVPDSTFWVIASLYSLSSYFLGHQGSHLAALRAGTAVLNPVLVLPLVVYNWLSFLPLGFLIWCGYKTVWWYAVGTFLVGWVIRLAMIKIEMASGLTRSAWAISLLGILVIPASLFTLGAIVASIK